MARIRSVHPDICLSETLASLSAEVERTFVRLWTYCDDEGRAVAHPKLLKAALYPMHDLTPEQVMGDIAELEAGGVLVTYEVAGKQYLQIKPESWQQYQKPARPTPSKLPPPPSTSSHDVHGEPMTERPDSVEPIEPAVEPIEPAVEPIEPAVEHTAPQVLEMEMEMEMEMEREREGGVGGTAAGEQPRPPPRPPPKGGPPQEKPSNRKRKTPVPADFTPSEPMLAWATEHRPNADVTAEAATFVSWHRAKGSAFVDVQQAFLTWLQRIPVNGHAANGHSRDRPTIAELAGVDPVETAAAKANLAAFLAAPKPPQGEP